MRLALSNGLNRVDTFLPSPDDGKWIQFPKRCDSYFPDFRKMDNFQNPSNSDRWCSSELLRDGKSVKRVADSPPESGDRGMMYPVPTSASTETKDM
jgi:hypothetical protein